MDNETFYDENDVKLSEWMTPVGGFIRYVRRNIKANTNDSNQYANGFYHLLGAQIFECLSIGILIKEGLEKLLK